MKTTGRIGLAAKCFAAVIAMTSVLAASAGSPAPEEKVLRHVVLFRYKEGTTPERKKQIQDAFRALPSKINLIRGMEWGSNVSPENLSQGFTDCFFLTFASDKDRDAYLVHPAHKAFGDFLGDSLDKVLVVDYWAQK